MVIIATTSVAIGVYFAVAAELMTASALNQEPLWGIARALIPYLADLAVGAWLFSVARRDGSSPWVWGGMGAVFGLVAGVLYFVMQLAIGHESSQTRAVP